VSLNRSAYRSVPLRDYAYHNDDQDTDQKDSDGNSDRGVLKEPLDGQDNSPRGVAATPGTSNATFTESIDAR